MTHKKTLTVSENSLIVLKEEMEWYLIAGRTENPKSRDSCRTRKQKLENHVHQLFFEKTHNILWLEGGFKNTEKIMLRDVCIREEVEYRNYHFPSE
jgi:hypothetical protein